MGIMGRCRSTRPLSTLSTRFDTELGQLRETARSLEQRLAKLEDTSARAQHDLREQVLEQAKSFLDELHRTREALTDTINRELISLELEPAEELTKCPRCDGRLLLVALVKDEASASRFATSLGEPTEAPAQSPPRPPPYFREGRRVAARTFGACAWLPLWKFSQAEGRTVLGVDGTRDYANLKGGSAITTE